MTADVRAFLSAHMPDQIRKEHREKFEQDVITDLRQLDVARLPGLGVDKAQLQAWLGQQENPAPR